MTLIDIGKKLYTLNYFPGKAWEQVKRPDIIKAIDKYLVFTGNKPDPKTVGTTYIPSDRVVNLIETRRCGFPDLIELAQSKWQFPDVRYYQNIVFPGISPELIAHCYDQAWKSWQKVCGLTPVRVLSQSQSNVHARAARIDRAGSILAYAYFPVQGIRSESQEQVYDTADIPSYSKESFLTAVIAHETGHSIGIGHGPGGICLMSPYVGNIIVPQQTYDIPEAQNRYGRALPIDPELPPPPLIPSFVGAW
jgi:hypothetical protein